jgi:hypothetical protein
MLSQSDQSNNGTRQPSNARGRWIGFLYFIGTVGFVFAFFYVLGLFS